MPTSLDARRSDTRRRMWLALAINVGILVAEVVGGLITGSLALLADAGHVLSDVGAIGLGLGAAALAMRPGGVRRTFGYQRGEVIAALVNGLTLVAVAVLVLVAAIDRLGDPPEVEGVGVLVLGVLGLAGNVVATLILARGEREDINLEGVLRHSAADALGSIGVVISGAVILLTGWQPIDPIASIAIALVILASSWRLIVEPVNVLMEAAPSGTDPDEIGREVCAIDDVVSVHELHVWTVTPGFVALAAHVVVGPECNRDLVRQQIEAMLGERHGIQHTTLQMEREVPDQLLQVEGPPREGREPPQTGS